MISSRLNVLRLEYTNAEECARIPEKYKECKDKVEGVCEDVVPRKPKSSESWFSLEHACGVHPIWTLVPFQKREVGALKKLEAPSTWAIPMQKSEV